MICGRLARATSPSHVRKRLSSPGERGTPRFRPRLRPRRSSRRRCLTPVPTVDRPSREGGERRGVRGRWFLSRRQPRADGDAPVARPGAASRSERLMAPRRKRPSPRLRSSPGGPQRRDAVPIGERCGPGYGLTACSRMPRIPTPAALPHPQPFSGAPAVRTSTFSVARRASARNSYFTSRESRETGPARS